MSDIMEYQSTIGSDGAFALVTGLAACRGEDLTPALT